MFDGRGTKRPRLADPQHASSDSGGSSRWQPESHSHRKASPESSDQYYTDPDLELFSDKSLFAVDVPALENGPVFGGEKSSFFDSTISSSAIDNFQYDQFALETQLLSWASVSSVGEPSEDSPAYDEEREWIAQILRPSLPLLEDRIVNLRLDNPYDDNGESRHKTLREEVFQPQNGAVNGYIKFRILDADLSDRNNRAGLLGQAALGLHRRRKFQDSEAEGPFSHVPRLPPDFGRGLKLNQTDSKLLKFCETPQAKLSQDGLHSLTTDRSRCLLPGPHSPTRNKFLVERNRTYDGWQRSRQARSPRISRSISA